MMQGLTQEDGEAIKDCFRKFIDLMVVYHETTRVPWDERPLEVGGSSKSAELQKEVGGSSKSAELQGQKEVVVRDETQKDAMNNPGVKVKIEEESSQDNNDFEDIA